MLNSQWLFITCPGNSKLGTCGRNLTVQTLSVNRVVILFNAETVTQISWFVIFPRVPCVSKLWSGWAALALTVRQMPIY